MITLIIAYGVIAFAFCDDSLLMRAFYPGTLQVFTTKCGGHGNPNEDTTLDDRFFKHVLGTTCKHWMN